MRILAIIFLAFLVPAAFGQDPDGPPLRLSGVFPSSVRTSVTQKYGALDFELTNLTGTDREVRVLAGYAGRPDMQYGRDVWVPAHSTLTTWMLLGPAPADGPPHWREVQLWLYDRTGGKNVFIPPKSGERIRTRLLIWRPREPSTTILLDEDVPPLLTFGELPRPPSPQDEALTLVRTFRAVRELSEYISRARAGPLPAVPEALDGVDHFVLASGRIADDPAGTRTLRRWLQRGGRMWVMLDLVPPEAIAALLGDAVDFQMVDRTSLTNFTIETTLPGRSETEPPLRQQHERPVDFVRVLLPPGEAMRHTIDGWPIWFTRKVGRGHVVFTTLGARGWHRPRTRRDKPSPYLMFPNLPIPTSIFQIVADDVHPVLEEGFRIDSYRQCLADEIGYSIVGRGTVGTIFAAFVLTTLALGIFLRRWGRAEWLGWVGPGAALTAAGVFLVLGESSRRAAPAGMAVAGIVEADGTTQDAAVRGLLAVYRPDGGPIRVEAEQGGLVELDLAGVEGQTIRRMTTDRDSWHLENLSLPAGLRLAAFRWSLPTEQPITAVARLGPEGLEGKLSAAPLRGLADAVLSPPGDRNLAVRLDADGTFRAGSKDVLAPGQFLAGTLLSDSQQRRQELYREYLKIPPAGRIEQRTFLLAWAEPIDMHLRLGENARATGSTLLVVPLRLERPAPGTHITIPAPLLAFRRVWERGWTRLNRESTEAADLHLRFQLPHAVLPFKVERARLNVRIDAPGRRVTISGITEDGGDKPRRSPAKLTELHRIDSPLDPIRVEITAEPLLRLDDHGGLHVYLHVGDVPKGASGTAAGGSAKWTIHYVELEVAGRVAERPVP